MLPILQWGCVCKNVAKKMKTAYKVVAKMAKQEEHDGPISLTWVPSSKGVQRL